MPNNHKASNNLTIHTLPEGLKPVIDLVYTEENPCHLCINTLMTFDGTFGESWLSIGQDSLAIFEKRNDTYKSVWQSNYASLDKIKMENVTDGAIVHAITSGKLRQVLRCHSSSAALVGNIVGQLQKDLKQKEKLNGHFKVNASSYTAILEKERSLYCQTCTKVFPRNTKVCPFCTNKSSTMKRILQFALPYKKQLITMIALMLSSTAVSLIPPQLTRYLIDDVLTKPKDSILLFSVVGILVLTMALHHGLQIIFARLGTWTGGHITRDIQCQTFNHLQTLSLSYYNKQQSGALMSKLSNDTRQMQGFLVEGIQFTVTNFLTLIGVSIILLWMNPFLGILAILPTPIVVIMSAWTWKKISRKFSHVWHHMSEVYGYLNDALSGIRVIKAFGKEQAEIDTFDIKSANCRDALITAEQTWQTLIPILNFTVQFSVPMIWFFGSFEIYGERLSIGQLVAYISYLSMIHGPLQLLSRLNDWASRGLTAAARVFEIMDTEPEIVDPVTPHSMPNIRGHIQLKNIVYGYEKHNPVINDVSLEVKEGEMVGLVGHSGAGKSTIINLISRLYDVDDGEILIDGINVKKISSEDLRKNIGYVLQDTYLFHGSIADNIAFSNPEAKRSDIIEVAHAANAHEFIMKLKDGYDTYIGERGVSLSGGERQRISIARAILLNPKILILDEATSSVDTETEAKIQNALTTLVKGRTTFAIAHRLSTLRHADRLVVFEKGQIKEIGSHKELMEIEGGIYKKFVDIQTEWSRTIGVA